MTSHLLRYRSFFTGAARTLDLFGSIDAQVYSSVSDSDALRSDWEAVGQDLKQAISQYEQKSV